MMDYFLLLLVKQIMKCATTYFRIFIASSIGALLTCIVVLLPIPYVFIDFLLFHVVINTLMIKIGFTLRDRRKFIQCFISLYICSFLMGGVFQYIGQYLKVSSLFFFLAVLSYWIVEGIWRFVSCLQRQEEKWLEVDIYINQQMIHVKALVDTGNTLLDSYTGKPVSVIEKDLLVTILDPDEKGRYIPFHSLGNDGVLYTITAQKLHICGIKDCWVENPLIALSEETLSVNQNYGMILNPDIL